MNPGSSNQFEPKGMFGNNDICNFGKYKDKSWYDIANTRNFGYFQWVLDNIAIHPDCIQHINCAMDQKLPFLNNNNLLWTKEEKPIENGNIQRQYKCIIDEKELDSPTIEMKYCVSCNILNPLNRYILDEQKKICNRCCHLSMKEFKPMNNQPPPIINSQPFMNQNSHQPEFQRNQFPSQNSFRPKTYNNNYPYRKSNGNQNYYQ